MKGPVHVKMVMNSTQLVWFGVQVQTRLSPDRSHIAALSTSAESQAEKFNPGLQLASFKNFKRTQQL